MKIGNICLSCIFTALLFLKKTRHLQVLSITLGGFLCQSIWRKMKIPGFPCQSKKRINTSLYQNLSRSKFFTRAWGFIFWLGFLSLNIHKSQYSRESWRLVLTFSNFHPLHEHFEISWAITEDRSPLHIASDRTPTRIRWSL